MIKKLKGVWGELAVVYQQGLWTLTCKAEAESNGGNPAIPPKSYNDKSRAPKLQLNHFCRKQNRWYIAASPPMTAFLILQILFLKHIKVILKSHRLKNQTGEGKNILGLAGRQKTQEQPDGCDNNDSFSTR